MCQCKLNINNAEIIACKLELLQKPIIDLIIQEISAERERSITRLLRFCLRHKQTKLRFMSIWNPISELQPRANCSHSGLLVKLYVEIRTEAIFESYNNILKVVFNEKQRWDGRWYTLGIGSRRGN